MASQEDLYNQQAEIKSLVTSREYITEAFLKEIIDSLPSPPDSSAVELAKAWKDEAKKRLNNMSVTLSHRVQPLVQLMLEQKIANSMDQSFSTIQTVKSCLSEMTLKYRRSFNVWVDASSHVSFKATNSAMLGKLSEKDAFILTFFSFLTCKRSKYDNCLQLGVVGCSTSGKSTLFEACLMEGSHVTTNESGVGRFQVGNKPVLMFHDIDIHAFAVGKDSDKIKTIARTEPTVTKIHGTVYTLPPLFVFYSSNERLLSHKFADAPLERASLYLRHFQSQIVQIGRKRPKSEESILAIQNRFIEAFVRAPPPLNKADLPQSGGFSRLHAIYGLFPRIISILQKYTFFDFYSPVLILYVLRGLCKNFKEYTSVCNDLEKETLLELIEKLVETNELKPSLVNLLTIKQEANQ